MKNLAQMMKQVQDMQEKMQSMQEDLKSLEITGSGGAGMVTVTLNGKGEMRAIKLDPTLLEPAGVDPAGVDVLEDLICAATNDARARLDERMAEEMQKMTGGLPLPPGFKLPF